MTTLIIALLVVAVMTVLPKSAGRAGPKSHND